MDGGTLDDCYLTWLYGQVADVRSRRSTKTFWDLLKQLYKIEFTWVIPNDERRAADGIELRYEWALEKEVGPDRAWFDLGCSFLELLIGLSRRLAFQTEYEPRYWFWHLIDNLGFLEFHDKSGYSRNFVTKRIAVVCDRSYDDLGNGGLFPLRNPMHDQRRVELWYQLCEYVLQD